MDKLKSYLPFVGALVLSVSLFAVDSTAYHNAANEIDYAKAMTAFGVLYASFTAFLKANPQ